MQTSGYEIRRRSIAEIFGEARAYQGQRAERAWQVRAQMLLGFIGLSGLDGPRDQAVMTDDILRLAGRGQMHPAQPVDMAAAAAHQRPEILFLRGRVQLAMEFIVGGHELLE